MSWSRNRRGADESAREARYANLARGRRGKPVRRAPDPAWVAEVTADMRAAGKTEEQIAAEWAEYGRQQK